MKSKTWWFQSTSLCLERVWLTRCLLSWIFFTMIVFSVAVHRIQTEQRCEREEPWQSCKCCWIHGRRGRVRLPHSRCCARGYQAATSSSFSHVLRAAGATLYTLIQSCVSNRNEKKAIKETIIWHDESSLPTWLLDQREGCKKTADLQAVLLTVMIHRTGHDQKTVQRAAMGSNLRRAHARINNIMLPVFVAMPQNQRVLTAR